MYGIIELHKGRPIKLQVKVLVPVHDHPNFNFVGKLLGPKGNSLKRLQEATQTRMAILGKGSMRNKEKEEQLRSLGDPKHSHLNQELHVEISTFAPASEAYGRIAHALSEVKRFLVPDYYDDIRQHQLRELAILNGDKKQNPEHGNDTDTDSSPTSPTSTETSLSPPEGSLRMHPPQVPNPPPLPSPRSQIVHATNVQGSNMSGRISRQAYPSYRAVTPVITPSYQRMPIYRNLDTDPPSLILQEANDVAYDDGFPEDYYEPLYDNNGYQPLGDAKNPQYACSLPTMPHDPVYEQSFYFQNWKQMPCEGRRRLPSYSIRSVPRATYRQQPYALPICQ